MVALFFEQLLHICHSGCSSLHSHQQCICGIFPNQDLNVCALYWEVDSFFFFSFFFLFKYGTLHEFACHPCAGATLIFSVSFQFQYMRCRSEHGRWILNQWTTWEVPNQPLSPQHRILLISLVSEEVIWHLPNVGFPRPRGGGVGFGHVMPYFLGGKQLHQQFLTIYQFNFYNHLTGFQPQVV